VTNRTIPDGMAMTAIPKDGGWRKPFYPGDEYDDEKYTDEAWFYGRGDSKNWTSTCEAQRPTFVDPPDIVDLFLKAKP
jgi:hypothetical protein